MVVLYLLLTCHYNYVMGVINRTSAAGYGSSLWVIDDTETKVKMIMINN